MAGITAIGCVGGTQWGAELRIQGITLNISSTVEGSGGLYWGMDRGKIVIESGTVNIDVPGWSVNAPDVQIDGGYVTLKGKHTPIQLGADMVQSDENGQMCSQDKTFQKSETPAALFFRPQQHYTLWVNGNQVTESEQKPAPSATPRPRTALPCWRFWDGTGIQTGGRR